jgi:hypothetical protein
MNWSSVGFTPSGGSLASYDAIDNVSIDYGGQLEKYAGGADVYNTTVVNGMNEPSVSIDSTDPAQWAALSIGTTGTLTATWNDAKLATGGAIVYTLINAVVEKNSAQGAHAKMGTASIGFSLYSSDGTTSPISFTRS